MSSRDDEGVRRRHVPGDEPRPSTSSGNSREEELTVEQTELMLHFQEITGESDLDVSRGILSRHSWDIESAVRETLHLPRTPPTEEETPPHSHRHSEANGTRALRADGPLEAVSPYQRPLDLLRPPFGEGPVSWILFFATLPFRIFNFGFGYFIEFIVRFIQPGQRGRLTDPTADLASFIEAYERRFGTAHPKFSRRSYRDVLAEAKNALRFLVVYLHSEDHANTAHFCREVLADRAVIEFLDTRCIFWACSINLGEGLSFFDSHRNGRRYNVSQIMRECSYPFLGVVCLRENHMSIVGRIVNPPSAARFIENLEEIFRNNEELLRVARSKKDALENMRKEIRIQNEAYKLALEKDRQKDRERQEKEERERRQREEEREAELRKQAELSRLRKEYSMLIPAEPEEGIGLSVILPSGTRITRKFRPSDQLVVVYYVVFCHEEAPDHFEIFTTYPKTRVPCTPSEAESCLTLSEYGLATPQTLRVLDLEA